MAPIATAGFSCNPAPATTKGIDKGPEQGLFSTNSHLSSLGAATFACSSTPGLPRLSTNRQFTAWCQTLPRATRQPPLIGSPATWLVTTTAGRCTTPTATGVAAMAFKWLASVLSAAWRFGMLSLRLVAVSGSPPSLRATEATLSMMSSAGNASWREAQWASSSTIPLSSCKEVQRRRRTRCKAWKARSSAAGPIPQTASSNSRSR
mmetsp:Transcript_3696/g.9579  ORF Transcript_3696/g.9579 Transcript_3696/m.9579 type:complete len:206 (-) Transcript_3696:625-1242(-)